MNINTKHSIGDSFYKVGIEPRNEYMVEVGISKIQVINDFSVEYYMLPTERCTHSVEGRVKQINLDDIDERYTTKKEALEKLEYYIRDNQRVALNRKMMCYK